MILIEDALHVVLKIIAFTPEAKENKPLMELVANIHSYMNKTL